MTHSSSQRERAEAAAEARALLALHARRKLRVFMVAPDPGNHADTRVWDAFWSLIYGDIIAVDHETARAIEAELSASEHTVADVLDGWRPEMVQRLNEIAKLGLASVGKTEVRQA